MTIANSTDTGYSTLKHARQVFTASANVIGGTRILIGNSASGITATYPSAPADAGHVLFAANLGAGDFTLTLASGVTWDGTNQSLVLHEGEHIIAVSLSVDQFEIFRIGTARQLLTANGAIAIPQNALSVVGLSKAGVLAATLALPTAVLDDGKIMIITAETANAHTVTTPSNGFNGGTHVATFGGAIGDSIMLVALNGVWNVVNSKNITLS